MSEEKLPAEITSHPDFGKNIKGKEEDGFNNYIYISSEFCTPTAANRIYCINRDTKNAYNVTLQLVTTGRGSGTFQQVMRNEAGGRMFLSCTNTSGYFYSWSVIGEVQL